MEPNLPIGIFTINRLLLVLLVMHLTSFKTIHLEIILMNFIMLGWLFILIKIIVELIMENYERIVQAYKNGKKL